MHLIGGVQAELLNDGRLILPDESRQSVIGGAMPVEGRRPVGRLSRPALDLDALAELIVRVRQPLCNQLSIREIDLNPSIAYRAGQGLIALDALIMVQ